MTAIRDRSAPAIGDHDDVLVERAARGDHQAFAALYRATSGQVYGLLTRLVGPRAEREDLLQDVFVRFHRALPRFERRSALATFLHKITVHVAYDFLRAAKRRPALVAEDTERPVAASMSVNQRAEVTDVMRFLDQLTPEQRIAFILREVVELSYPEIAKLAGCFTTTARMRVAAANRVLARVRSRA